MDALTRIALALAIILASTGAHADTTLALSTFGARRPLAHSGERRATQPSEEVLRNAFGLTLGIVDGPPAGARGLVVRAGVGFEHAADCAWFDRRPACAWPGGHGPAQPAVPLIAPPPDNRFEYGAHGRIGWDFHYLALEAGAVTYSITRATPERYLRPDAMVRLGPQASSIALGYGTSSPTTMFYPGPYVRAHLDFAERWSTAAGGAAAFQADRVHYRLDLELSHRLTRNLALGDGVAVLTANGFLTGELRLFANWRFD